MAFEDLDWASDANYPAGSESWSATPTRVEPSAGQQAAGVAPEDVLPAQWFNWLFGEVVDAGQALETLVGAGTLQAAWANSETAGDDPHIDVTGSQFRVGLTGGDGILDVSGATRGVTLNAATEVVSPYEFTLTDASQLIITNAGAALAPTVLQFTGAGDPTEYVVTSGAWTPVVSSTAGTGCDVADFTSLVGHYTRNGNVVTFTIAGAVSTTGWLNTCQAFIAPPVTGTLTSIGGTVLGWRTLVRAYDRAQLFVGAGNTIRVDMIPNASDLGASTLEVSGQYLLA